MPSAVQICNVGLSRVKGTNLIQSLTDNSREAKLCNVHFAIARDSCLAEIDWPFARRQTAMNALTETWSGYTYVYKQPVDCITAREIYNPAISSSIIDPRVCPTVEVSNAQTQRIPFDKGLSSTGNFAVILTNIANAELIYTAQITNEAQFPPVFADALGWRLAAELAIPLTGDVAKQQQLMKTYAAILGIAKARASNEEVTQPSSFSNFASARN